MSIERPITSRATSKLCIKCSAFIAADEVQLAPRIEERCHDCADYCDDPACGRCKANGASR